MRLLGLALLVTTVGCGAHAAPGPAWPKPHATLADGGQSLAPRPSNPVAAAADVTEEEEVVPEISLAPVAAAAPVVTPTVPAIKPATPDEPIMTEEMIIEVDE